MRDCTGVGAPVCDTLVYLLITVTFARQTLAHDMYTVQLNTK